jgi:hypothetical protein
MGRKRVDILQIPGAQVIKYPYLAGMMADQIFSKIGTNKSGTSGDQE